MKVSFERNYKLNRKELFERKKILQSFPTGTLQIEITTKCNITPPCVMCIKSNPQINDISGNNQRDIDSKLINKLKNIFPFAQQLYINAVGEPLLCSRFYDFLERENSNIVFNTNGLLLNEAMSRRIILCQKVKTVSFSLDAVTAETYRKIRGADFKKVIFNIKRLAELKKEMNSQRPLICASMVIMKENIKEIPYFPYLAKAIGVEIIECPFMIPQGDYKINRGNFQFDSIEQKIEFDDDIYEHYYSEMIKNAEEVSIKVRTEF